MDNFTQNSSLLLLSIAAGCVDAIAFVNAGVFPANMSGNSVVLAAGILHPATGAAALSALVLAGFCAGAAAGAWIVHSPDHAWSRRISLALLFSGVLVLGCALAILLAPGHFLSMIIVAVSAAMGMQSAAVQQLGIAGVATVFVTGTLTTAITRFVGLARETVMKEPLAEKDPWLPAFSWLSYFAGAFIGGLQLVLHTAVPVVLPGALLVAVALAGEWRLRETSKQGA